MNKNLENRTTTVKVPENAFNAIRLFCCLVVILGHCFDLSKIDSSFRKFIDMHISVCVFFFLSGFWVFNSYLKSSSIKEYFRKRVHKLLPMYYITVLGYSILCSFFSELPYGCYFTNKGFWKYLLFNGVFLNFLAPSLPGVFNGEPVNGALWTIKIEVGFYLILPLLVYCLKKLSTKKGKNGFLLVIYVLSITWNYSLSYLGKNSPFVSDLAHQLPGFMSYFVCGMMWIINWDYLLGNINYYIVPSIFIFILHYFTHTEFLLPLSLSVIVIFIGIRFTSLSFIGKPIDYSYGMYLFHFPLINILSFNGWFKNGFLFCFISVVAITFFSYPLHRKVYNEK